MAVVARKLRVESAEAVDYLMNRLKRRYGIFRDGAGRRSFIDSLGAVNTKTAMAGACLLPDAQPHTPQAFSGQ